MVLCRAVASRMKSFREIPNGTYTSAGAFTFGNYNIFYNSLNPIVVVPGGGGGIVIGPDDAFNFFVNDPSRKIDVFERVDERTSDQDAFTFANYWTQEGEWRTDSYNILYLGEGVDLNPEDDVPLDEATGVPGDSPPPLPSPESDSVPAQEEPVIETGTQGFGVEPTESDMGGEMNTGDDGLEGFGGMDAGGGETSMEDAPEEDPFSF